MFDFIITLLPGSAGWTHLSKTRITVLQWSRRAFNTCLHPIFSAFFEGMVIKNTIILNTGCFTFNLLLRHQWEWETFITESTMSKGKFGCNWSYNYYWNEFKNLFQIIYQNICLIVFLLQHMYRPKWTGLGVTTGHQSPSRKYSQHCKVDTPFTNSL